VVVGEQQENKVALLGHAAAAGVLDGEEDALSWGSRRDDEC